MIKSGEIVNNIIDRYGILKDRQVSTDRENGFRIS